jgi:hypothetical protein
MEPVQIRYYGLFWLTKSGYLIGTLIAACGVVVGFLMAYPTGYLPPPRWPWEPVPDPYLTGARGWLYNHLYDLALFCLVMEAIDIVVTLRRFARKEAERRAAAAGSRPTQPSHLS